MGVDGERRGAVSQCNVLCGCHGEGMILSVECRDAASNTDIWISLHVYVTFKRNKLCWEDIEYIEVEVDGFYHVLDICQEF